MDLSKLSTEDLMALKAGRLQDVSTDGLKMLKGEQADEQPAPSSFVPSRNANSGPVRAASALSSGFNRAALSYLPGMAMDTAINAFDLGKAGLGFLTSKATGKPPSEMFDPTDRSKIMLSSAWLQDILNKNDVTRAATNAGISEFPSLAAAGSAIGSALATRGPAQLAGGAKEIARTAAIAGPAAAGGQQVAESTGVPESGLLAEMLASPTLAQASQIMDLKPRMLFDTASAQARNALAPFTKQQIDRAIQDQRLAAAMNNPIAASQALGGAPGLIDLENYALGSPWTPSRNQQMVAAQPEAARNKAFQTIRTLGQPDTSLGRANQIEAAAEAGLRMPKEIARQAAQPFYDALARSRPQLPESVRWDLAAKLRNVDEQVGLLEKSYAAQGASDAAGRAMTDSLILSPQKGNKPFQRAEGGIYELDNYLKELNTRINKLDSIGADSKQAVERAGLKPIAADIQRTLLENSPMLASAKQTYRSVRDQLGEYVRSSGIKSIAPSPDASGEMKAPANWSTIKQLITREQSPENLRQANYILGRTDPDAVAAVTRNVLDEQFRSVYGSQSQARPDPRGPFDLAQKIRAVPNIETAIEITAARNGASNPTMAAKGFMRLLDVIELSGLPRGLPGKGSVAATEQLSPERTAATLAFGHGLAQQSAILRRAQQVIDFREIRKLNDVLFDADSVAKLQKLADMDPFTAKAQQLAKDILKPSPAIQSATVGTILPGIQEMLNR